MPQFAWKRRAVKGLTGVGDASRGEWHEFTGKAYHLRRRLTESEDIIIGAAIDLRGTSEAIRRFEAMKPFLSARHEALANEELKLNLI